MNTMMRFALLATVLVSTSACIAEPYVDDEMDEMEDTELDSDDAAQTSESSLVFGTETEGNNSYFAANLITKNGMKGQLKPTSSVPNDRDWFKWKIPSNAEHCFKLVNAGIAVMDIVPANGTSQFGVKVKSKCLSNKKGTDIFIMVHSTTAGATTPTYTLKITTP